MKNSSFFLLNSKHISASKRHSSEFAAIHDIYYLFLPLYFYILVMLLLLLPLMMMLMFLLPTTQVLITKLRSANTLETRQYHKASKALLVLIPLFGITYLLVLVGPEQGLSANVFDNTRAFLISTQVSKCSSRLLLILLRKNPSSILSDSPTHSLSLSLSLFGVEV